MPARQFLGFGTEGPEQNVQEVQRPQAENNFAPLLQRPLRAAERPDKAPAPNSVAVGFIVAMDDAGPMVRIPCLGGEACRARSLCALPEDWENRECAVLFENGDRNRPLILGLMLDTPQTSPSLERVLCVDGERVVVQADTELELRCGESVILMQRDGRIEIRGNYVTSQATATHRIRGGSINMN